MQLRAGTSGFSYAEWRGGFYPADLPDGQMLTFYAGRLPAVEINNTFYRLPKSELLASWHDAVGSDFRFVLKASRRITHMSRLVNTADTLAYLWQAAGNLREKLGPILFQLPPFMRKDLGVLGAFLSTLPAGLRAAIEFRHASWLADDVYEVLRRHGAALCVADSEEFATPLEATAGWGYLRLRRQDYDDAALRGWAERLRAQRFDETFVFFKHEDEGAGPRLAESFRSMMI